MPPVYFATSSSQSRAPALSGERLVNCFVERQAPEAKGPAPIFGAPGMDLTVTAGTGPIRGRWIFQGVLYVVSGTELWSVSAGYVATNHGGPIPGTGQVSMADNGVQLCIVNGGGMTGAGWIYTPAGGLVKIANVNFYPSDLVLFFDGYFLFNRSGTNEWFLSALYDGTAFNGLDFAVAEASTENIVGIAANLQLVFIFCEKHIELWYDAGSNSFPFARYAGGVIPYGTISPHTILEQDGALFFLGSDKTFYRLQANTPIRVSTHAIETIISADPDLTQAYCQTYTTQGHKMVALTLAASGRTLVLDLSSGGKWHERVSFDASGKSLSIWRATCAVEVYGQVLFGDAFDGSIGKLNWAAYTEYGNTLPMVAVSAPVHKERLWVFLEAFELDVQPGVGLIAGQGSDPQCMLRVSKDGGETYKPMLKWKSLGKLGERLRRLRWLRFGKAYSWTIEVTITDPVFRCIIQAYADIEVAA